MSWAIASSIFRMFSACCCSWLWVLNLRQLGDAVDELGDLGAEPLLDVGQAVLGVLGDVVEERGLDRGRVEAELGEDLGRRDRVGDVRLAGGALLALVGGDGEVERAVDRLEVGARGAPARIAAWRRRPERLEVRSLAVARRARRAHAGGRGARAVARGLGLRWSPCRRRSGAPGVGFGGSRSPSAKDTRVSRSRLDERVLGLGTLVPRMGPSGPMIERSWPLPASSTMSPGRARSNAASMAARRSAMSSRSWSRRLPAASAPARDRVEDRVAVLAARVLVGDDHEPGALARDPAHQRPLGRVALAGRAEDRDEPAAARAAASGASRSSTVWSEAGLWAKSTMTPNGWPSVDALHPARARPASDASPARTAAGSRPTASPRATTASALWTLNRPTSWRSSGRRARWRLVGDAQAAGVLLDARRADVGRRVRAVGQDARAGLLGRRR